MGNNVKQWWVIVFCDRYEETPYFIPCPYSKFNKMASLSWFYKLCDLTTCDLALLLWGSWEWGEGAASKAILVMRVMVWKESWRAVPPPLGRWDALWWPVWGCSTQKATFLRLCIYWRVGYSIIKVFKVAFSAESLNFDTSSLSRFWNMTSLWLNCVTKKHLALWLYRFALGTVRWKWFIPIRGILLERVPFVN